MLERRGFIATVMACLGLPFFKPLIKKEDEGLMTDVVFTHPESMVYDQLTMAEYNDVVSYLKKKYDNTAIGVSYKTQGFSVSFLASKSSPTPMNIWIQKEQTGDTHD